MRDGARLPPRRGAGGSRDGLPVPVTPEARIFFCVSADERFVFAVGGGDDAEFLGELEDVWVKLAVVDAEGAFCRRGKILKDCTPAATISAELIGRAAASNFVTPMW